MLGFLLPVLYWFDMDGADIDTFLRYQSMFVLLGFVILRGRIWALSRKTRPTSARAATSQDSLKTKARPN